MVLASSTEVAQRLVDWSNGNKAALDRLMPLVYKELLFGFTLYSDKMTVNSVTRYRTASGSDRPYATAPLNIVRAGRYRSRYWNELAFTHGPKLRLVP